MSKKVQHAIILGLIFVGVLIVFFFGLRAFFAFREFRRHGLPPHFAPAEAQAAETDVELIRDWMTIPYISRAYHVHPKILFDALGITPRGNEEKNLAQLNEEFFPDTPGIVIESVKAAILANQPPPTPIIPANP
ncbi:MAG TPA: hypothetical protein VLT51_00040 [Anaerolineales bacterium]|nr:hypothetical protein [Anaerolineales bacterium]